MVGMPFVAIRQRSGWLGSPKCLFQMLAPETVPPVFGKFSGKKRGDCPQYLLANGCGVGSMSGDGICVENVVAGFKAILKI